MSVIEKNAGAGAKAGAEISAEMSADIGIGKADRQSLVLLIEDNPDVSHLNAKWLEKAGYDTLCATTLTETRKIFESASPDIVVLDILLPDGNGLEFLPELKTLSGAPVLFCSSQNEDRDVFRGLEAGGDDYIPKPYNVDIFTARVNVMWRRERQNRGKLQRALAAKNLGREIELGPLKLDTLTLRACLEDLDVGLTPKQFALLFTLIQSEGREISARELYEAVWGMPANDDARTIKVHISQLKKKLRITDDSQIEINYQNEGYSLNLKQ